MADNGRRFVRDRYWFHDSRRGTLLAGSPLSYFKFTQEGSRVIDALDRGEDLPRGHEPLTSRLERAGAVHPVPGPPADTTSTTVVIPAFIRDSSDLEHLRTLVESLQPLAVIVVDDCSPVAVNEKMHGARVLRLSRNSGPAAARNEGLSQVETEIVAFIDSDVTISSFDVRRLASLVILGRSSMAAPRVSSLADGAIGEYEAHHSPLDMGDRPAVVSPHGRVPYVPSAVIVADTRVLRAHHAFDGVLRTGEDVDLVWRLVHEGEMCAYAPDIVCFHAPRQNVRRFVAQRYGYGRSAADLASRHPGYYSPYRSHLAATVPALLTVSGFFASAILLVLPAVAWLTLLLSGLEVSWRQKLRISCIAMAASVRLLARAARREWWLPLFCASFFFGTATIVLLLSIVAPLTWNLLRARPRYPLAYCGLRILDDATYGVGVWSGAIRARSLRVLMPRISVRRSVAR